MPGGLNKPKTAARKLNGNEAGMHYLCNAHALNRHELTRTRTNTLLQKETPNSMCVQVQSHTTEEKLGRLIQSTSSHALPMQRTVSASFWIWSGEFGACRWRMPLHIWHTDTVSITQQVPRLAHELFKDFITKRMVLNPHNITIHKIVFLFSVYVIYNSFKKMFQSGFRE